MAEDKPATIGRHRCLCHATALIQRRDGRFPNHRLGPVVDETPDAPRVRLRVHGQTAHQHQRYDAEETKRDCYGTDEPGMHFHGCVARSGIWGSM